MSQSIPLSSLQLKRHYVSELTFHAIEESVPEPHEVEIGQSIGMGHAVGDDRAWRLALTIKFRVRKEKRELAHGSITFVGLFQIAESVKPEDRPAFVGVNGATILYGAAREMIVNLTSRSTLGTVLFPSVSFSGLAFTPESAAPSQIQAPAI